MGMGMGLHAATLSVWILAIHLISVSGFSYSSQVTGLSPSPTLPLASCTRCTRREVVERWIHRPHHRVLHLHRALVLLPPYQTRPFLLEASPASNGERENVGSSDAARRRAEEALRKLSPSELEEVRARLGIGNDDGGLQQHDDDRAEDTIARAAPIIVTKIRSRDAARRAHSGETMTDENGADELPAPETTRSARVTTRRPWGGDGRAGASTAQGRAERRGEWNEAPAGRAARDRRIGREEELVPGDRSYFATCPRGLETVLRDELKSAAIGAKMIKTSGRGCHFHGDQAVGYRAILWLRSAHRVLELIVEGGASPDPAIDNADSLYQAAATVPWSRYMEQGQTLSVDAILGVVPDGLTHSHFTALTVKNAVVDQFRNRGERPSVDTDNPDLPLVVYLDRGRALLYRSLSGARSMHKRGYRDAMHAASLKENVAAGLLLASGWDPETEALADPMCGSGTFLIEAALIAMRRAPGLVAMGAFRGSNSGDMKWFDRIGCQPAITSWPDFDAGLWREVVSEALQAARPSPPAAIMGNDWHHGALSLAWRDAKAAGVENFITLSAEDVSSWRPPVPVDLAVTNPPWDYRLDNDPEGSWRGLLEFLRRELAEKDAWVLSGNPSLSRVLRMKSEQNVYLATGGIELRWLQYRLHPYRGNAGGGRNMSGGRGRGRGGSRTKKVSRRHDRPAVDRW